MKILESLVTTPWAQAMGWTLLHSLWEGTVVAASLGAVLLSTRSARVRYAAACLAMLAMVTGGAVTLVRLVPDTGSPRVIAGQPSVPTPFAGAARDVTLSHPDLGRSASRPSMSRCASRARRRNS